MSESAGTVGELVVLVDYVFTSESGVAYLSHPRLVTTQQTVFPIYKELIFTSIQYLPKCRITCT